MADMVSVPHYLLAAVLDNAESDSYSTESEFSCSRAESERYEQERECIHQLRKIAGIETDGVVGQGFFGIALALADHKKPGSK